MRKVIANALFKVNDSFKGMNVSVTGDKNMDVYLKNSFISLYSAKIHNNDSDVMLVVNYELQDNEKKMFLDKGIKIIQLKTSVFNFPDNFKWAPAFFKLDALKYLSEYYDLVCVVDTDTVFVDKCKYLWEEAKNSLLIFDVDYSLESEKRKITIDLYNDLYKNKEIINHWGGEIICGSSQEIKQLINSCEDVYLLLEKDFDKLSNGFGQEALMSIAISKANIKIKRANKYCMRYWTRRFYLVDTNYNNISIWHLPAEKDRGLIKIFNKTQKNGVLPSKKNIAKLVFLKRKMNLYDKMCYYSKTLILKLKNGEQIKLRKKIGWIDK